MLPFVSTAGVDDVVFFSFRWLLQSNVLLLARIAIFPAIAAIMYFDQRFLLCSAA